jgi:repressor LexA
MTNPVTSLTPNEKSVLTFIADFIKKNDISPTFTEIQKAFGYSSVNSVQNYVRQLERKGYISLEPHQKRAIRLRASHSDFSAVVASLVKEDSIEVKVEAKVAAGGPIEYAVFDKVIKVDRGLLPRSGSFFAVEVQGDSMMDAGILSGDVLILSKLNFIYPGVTAVVSIEDEGATVKKIYPHVSKKSFELRPANSNYQSRMVSENAVSFEGQLVALVRKY